MIIRNTKENSPRVSEGSPVGAVNYDYCSDNLMTRFASHYNGKVFDANHSTVLLAKKQQHNTKIIKTTFQDLF